MLDPKIYEKLTRYCAGRERSVSEVKQKLYALKVEKSEMENYVIALERDNFINEKRFVKSFVEAHTRKKWGKVKIKSALLNLGINNSLISAHLEQIEENDYDEQVKALALKKWKSLKKGTDAEKKNKLMRFLLSRGFESDRIKQVIKSKEFTS